MIGKRRLTLIGFLVLALAATTVAAAGSYEVNWWTVNGGGDTSEGDTYAVSGTLGQPDAGPLLEGTQFTVVGGFWGGAGAGPTPGPRPRVVLRPSLAVRHWVAV